MRVRGCILILFLCGWVSAVLSQVMEPPELCKAVAYQIADSCVRPDAS